MFLLLKFLTAHFHVEIRVLIILDEEALPMNYSIKGLANYFLQGHIEKKQNKTEKTLLFVCLSSFGDEAVSVLIVQL